MIWPRLNGFKRSQLKLIIYALLHGFKQLFLFNNLLTHTVICFQVFLTNTNNLQYGNMIRIIHSFKYRFIIQIIHSIRHRHRLFGPVGRVFTNDHVIPKTLKMVLDTSFLNTQQYNIRMESKVKQSRERSSALPYTSV